MVQVNFNAEEVPDELDPFEPLAAGWYKCTPTEPTKATYKDASNNVVDEQADPDSVAKFRVSATFDVDEGQSHAGRKIFAGFNLRNPSEKAVKISERLFARWTRAAGKLAVGDTDELLGITVMVKVRVKPAEGDYPAGNEPTDFMSVAEYEAGDADKKIPRPGKNGNGAAVKTTTKPLQGAKPAEKAMPPWQR